MRNRSSLIRERRVAFRDARLIVIASEGKDTERIYFNALAKEYMNPRVHVHILKRDEKLDGEPTSGEECRSISESSVASGDGLLS